MNVHSACAREWLAVRDGRHRWGDTSAVVGRYGVVVHTVVVYPPGCSTVDRRWIRAWRSLPMISILAFWICLAGFSTLMPIAGAFAATIGVILVLVAALAYRCRDLRRAVAELVTEIPPGSTDAGLHAREARALRLAASLDVAEKRLAEGRLDELEFQARWHAAYDSVRTRPLRSRARTVASGCRADVDSALARSTLE
ncbi:DUF6611 family protein [Agromyces sp. NPDC058110]|uniref:DUF6611 family protein n=1 Tax=Agromyces sp. NPDC058110 TaxID=3346345 RepID=UPI0036D9A2A3